MMKTRIVVATLALGLLGGCASNVGPKEGVGTLAGAALGGWAGSQIGHGTGNVAATALGVVIGGILGNQMGASMDKTDQMYAEQATTRAYSAPLNEPITWRNPKNGHYGTIVAENEGTTPSGRYCREYIHTVTIGGKSQKAHGTACREPDGSWKIVQ